MLDTNVDNWTDSEKLAAALTTTHVLTMLRMALAPRLGNDIEAPAMNLASAVWAGLGAEALARELGIGRDPVIRAASHSSLDRVVADGIDIIQAMNAAAELLN